MKHHSLLFLLIIFLHAASTLAKKECDITQCCYKTNHINDHEPAKKNQKNPLRKLTRHLEKNRDSINILRVNFILNRPNNRTENSDWETIIKQVEKISHIISETGWIKSCETCITNASNSARTTFTLGSDDTDPQGSIEITFGASDCCQCCYPECKCVETRCEGVCECNDENNQEKTNTDTSCCKK